jgi:magnesium transporter
MDTIFKEVNFGNFIWIDICNPNSDSLDKIAKDYNLDYYQIKDSLETGHLPKFEKQEKYKFLILRAYTAKVEDRITNISELSNKIAFFYSDKKIITVHRARFNFLEEFSVKPTDSEELLLFFIHKMTQTFEQPSKFLGEKNDEIEKTIFLKDYTKISLEELYFQKTQTRITKNLLQISQNVIAQIEVSEESKTALQDIKDKMLSLVLSYDEVLENSTNLFNTYMSVNAQKSNDVMKLLTIFSAFFLPLTFVVGIYGMNFENMPELKWQKGYFLTLGIMAVIVSVIYFWFKRKRII